MWYRSWGQVSTVTPATRPRSRARQSISSRAPSSPGRRTDVSVKRHRSWGNGHLLPRYPGRRRPGLIEARHAYAHARNGPYNPPTTDGLSMVYVSGQLRGGRRRSVRGRRAKPWLRRSIIMESARSGRLQALWGETPTRSSQGWRNVRGGHRHLLWLAGGAGMCRGVR